jgi:hypothetical protein
LGTRVTRTHAGLACACFHASSGERYFMYMSFQTRFGMPPTLLALADEVIE